MGPGYYYYTLPPVVELLVNSGDALPSDLRSSVGRRLAGGLSSNSGDLGTDREDSPLQSKRSSRFPFFLVCWHTIFVAPFICFYFNVLYSPVFPISHTMCCTLQIILLCLGVKRFMCLNLYTYDTIITSFVPLNGTSQNEFTMLMQFTTTHAFILIPSLVVTNR